ncbi:gem-associated protein 7 isoform X2 [Sagmatias obliquidens]|uniref:gem-associated protein 7 isoform X2 n=1 Tax=Sagmatias obliquidens TaxID=3371155 RepID=UPI000F44000B|nr:gem-associated protein 7 isoform X2 [Lagenorhynchus obliquidens]
MAPGSVLASEPASPPETTWGVGGAGGTQARRLAARPGLCSWGAGGSGGSSRCRPRILSCKELTVELQRQEEPHKKKDNPNHPSRIMQTPLTTTVPVLRLPRGPDGLSRGFAPDGRRALLKPVVPEIPESQESRESQEQRARAALRERYLRSLLAMVGRQVSFTLHEGVHVTAHFGATDLDVANFYVSQLQTPIGVQAEALLRCSDIISYTFKP